MLLTSPISEEQAQFNSVRTRQPIKVKAKRDVPELKVRKGELVSVVAVNPHNNAQLVRFGLRGFWYPIEDFVPADSTAQRLLDEECERAKTIIQT